MRRIALGIFALVCLVGGVLLLLLAPQQETYTMFGASALRVGMVLGAFWLAYPQLVRIPWWFVQAGLVSALLIAIRPKYAVIVLPLLVALWFIRPRRNHKNVSRKSRQPTRTK